MKNKRVEIAFNDINTKDIQVIDPKMTWTITSPAGNTVTETYYPLGLQIYNDSGAGIEFNIITSAQDYAEYQTIAPGDINNYYSFQRVPANAIIQPDFSALPLCYKFLVRGYTTTAISNLILEFINYR